MERGKHICSQLKAVRRSIAEENGIPLEIKECTYHGPCRGTCPRCEAEVRYLENALAERLRIGKVATVAGMALGLASCGGGASSDSGVQGSQAVALLPDSAEIQTPDSTLADSSKSVWRKPPDNMRNIYVGELEVIDTAFQEEYYEEGEVFPEVIIPDVEIPDVDTDLPEFPGGEEALYKFITDNLKYPQLALENGIGGKVYVSFIVETDGNISNVKVIRDIGGGCGREAARVVQMMPKWIPGKQNGTPARILYSLPVEFVLPKDRPRIIEGMAPVEYGTRMPADSAQHETIGPNAPTQQMEVEGVKVVVR